MLIPLSIDRPLRRPTLVNHWLMAINVAVYVVEMTLKALAPDAFNQMLAFMAMRPSQFEPWTVVTYQFAHADFLHLLFNMLFLFIFGPAVEDKFGRVRYLLFYLAGGAAAGGLHAAFFPNPLIGASGSIAGVTGAFLVFFPFTHVRVLLFFILIGTFSIPSWWLIAFAIARDIFMQGLGGAGNVAHLAHLGGYAWGIGLSLLLLATGKIEREPFDLFSVGRQRWRRRQFKEVTSGGDSPWRSDLSKAPRKTRKETAREQAEEQAARKARDVIRAKIRGDDAPGAAQEFKRFSSAGGDPRLGRDDLLLVANELFRLEERRASAAAYESFVTRFASDPETPGARLMLGLMYARYLDAPEEARAHLESAKGRLSDGSQRELAESLLAEVNDGAVER